MRCRSPPWTWRGGGKSPPQWLRSENKSSYGRKYFHMLPICFLPALTLHVFPICSKHEWCMWQCLRLASQTIPLPQLPSYTPTDGGCVTVNMENRPLHTPTQSAISMYVIICYINICMFTWIWGWWVRHLCRVLHCPHGEPQDVPFS